MNDGTTKNCEKKIQCHGSHPRWNSCQLLCYPLRWWLYTPDWVTVYSSFDGDTITRTSIVSFASAACRTVLVLCSSLVGATFLWRRATASKTVFKPFLRWAAHQLRYLMLVPVRPPRKARKRALTPVTFWILQIITIVYNGICCSSSIFFTNCIPLFHTIITSSLVRNGRQLHSDVNQFLAMP